MYISLIDKTQHLDKVWVKTFKNKEDMIKWLYNSVVHAEDDLYKIIKLSYTVKAKPGCSFLDTHYFEEDDFNIPIKEFFKKLRETCKNNRDNTEAFITDMNALFMSHHKHKINPISFKEVLKDEIDNMKENEKRDFFRSMHHSNNNVRRK